MGYEKCVHLLVINREGKESSSLESSQLRLKVFTSQAAMDQWLLEHYLKLDNGNVLREGNIQKMKGISKSGHTDVLVIRKERVYE